MSIHISKSYDIGVKVDEKGQVSFVADWWGVETTKGWSEEEFIQKVTQRYSYHKVKQEVEKSGVKITAKPTPLKTPEEQAEYDKQFGDRVSKEIGEDDVFLFVQAAQDILAGKEQFEGANVKGKVNYSKESDRKDYAKRMFRALAGGPDAAGRRARDIDNSLHNISSNPDARKTLEMLASLMRATKQKTIKDLENYLNQVYKQNHPEGDPTGYR